MRAGQYIVDGTAIFLVCDIRDGCLPGGVVHSYHCPDGYVKANGATVSRSNYPRLVAYANEHNLWDNENDGLYGTGDGGTTFRLPNLMGRFIESANAAGTLTEAGLPNVTGYIKDGLIRWDTSYTGALKTGFTTTHSTGGSSTLNYFYLDFDASRSNPIYSASTTVQPPSISLIPCIKY